ncbi:MAG: radical SAM protein [Chitinivibrionales bacterium]|nr:radical SAM protein [Chitinivibrionales bacterium]
MSPVLLIYPFFKPRRDRSRFRFPPLGLGYIAGVLQHAGIEVTILDCTFLSRAEAMDQALTLKSDIVGIYCMVSMLDDCRLFAKHLRAQTGLLVAGGPLPTIHPGLFKEHFDVVVCGEGEQTMRELVAAYASGMNLGQVSGVIIGEKSSAQSHSPGSPPQITAPRPFIKDLDTIPFPARKLLPNASYQAYGKKKYGYSITTVMSSRGCPYQCEFCSNVVFGGSYRERSPGNVVDEIEEVLKLGYDRISFADDVFTMKPERVLKICEEIRRRDLKFEWECLGRVDAINYSLAAAMKAAGCRRIYFGIESGNNAMLTLMRKGITTEQARGAVEAAHAAGLEVGAFFILFYPGDTNQTVLQTLHFALSLPLDYLGLSMPYPLPGTELYKRVSDRKSRPWRPQESIFGGHVLLFNADFSEAKMWFGIIKGHLHFKIRKILGPFARPLLRIFEPLTDALLMWLK